MFAVKCPHALFAGYFPSFRSPFLVVCLYFDVESHFLSFGTDILAIKECLDSFVTTDVKIELLLLSNGWQNMDPY